MTDNHKKPPKNAKIKSHSKVWKPKGSLHKGPSRSNEKGKESLEENQGDVPRNNGTGRNNVYGKSPEGHHKVFDRKPLVRKAPRGYRMDIGNSASILASQLVHMNDRILGELDGRRDKLKSVIEDLSLDGISEEDSKSSPPPSEPAGSSGKDEPDHDLRPVAWEAMLDHDWSIEVYDHKIGTIWSCLQLGLAGVVSVLSAKLVVGFADMPKVVRMAPIGLRTRVLNAIGGLFKGRGNVLRELTMAVIPESPAAKPAISSMISCSMKKLVASFLFMPLAYGALSFAIDMFPQVKQGICTKQIVEQMELVEVLDTTPEDQRADSISLGDLKHEKGVYANVR